MKKIKAIAFDADNTLYSTKAAAKPADMAAMGVLREATEEPAEKLYEEFLEIVNTVKASPDPKLRHRRHSYGLLCARYGVELTEEMYSALSKKLLELIEPVRGIKETLESFRNKEVKMYVITEDNRAMAEKKLEALGLGSYFDGVVTSDETGVMKPSEKYYENLLKEFTAEEILVIGDNQEKDLELPKSLGMKTLLVEKPEDLANLNT